MNPIDGLKNPLNSFGALRFLGFGHVLKALQMREGTSVNEAATMAFFAHAGEGHSNATTAVEPKAAIEWPQKNTENAEPEGKRDALP